MKSKTVNLIFSGLAVAVIGVWAPASEAATRTIQFAGMALASLNYGPTNLAGMNSDCYVLVVNTGSSPQQVNGISFASYNPASPITHSTATMPVGTTSNVDSQRIDSTGSSPAADCLSASNNQIAPGGVCTFHTVFYNVPFDSVVAVCAGTLTVADVSGNPPGSVVATGAIYQIQEAQVYGGILSGAYYASGSHINTWNYVNDQITNTFEPPIGHTLAGNTFNMNYNCSTACRLGLGQAVFFGDFDFCEENCGSDGWGWDPTQGVYEGNDPKADWNDYSQWLGRGNLRIYRAS